MSLHFSDFYISHRISDSLFPLPKSLSLIWLLWRMKEDRKTDVSKYFTHSCVFLLCESVSFYLLLLSKRSLLKLCWAWTVLESGGYGWREQLLSVIMTSYLYQRFFSSMIHPLKCVIDKWFILKLRSEKVWLYFG